jgi:hypothetical protein
MQRYSAKILLIGCIVIAACGTSNSDFDERPNDEKFKPDSDHQLSQEITDELQLSQNRQRVPLKNRAHCLFSHENGRYKYDEKYHERFLTMSACLDAGKIRRKERPNQTWHCDVAGSRPACKI